MYEALPSFIPSLIVIFFFYTLNRLIVIIAAGAASALVSLQLHAHTAICFALIFGNFIKQSLGPSVSRCLLPEWLVERLIFMRNAYLIHFGNHYVIWRTSVTGMTFGTNARRF